jgi:hypothetical protein
MVLLLGCCGRIEIRNQLVFSHTLARKLAGPVLNVSNAAKVSRIVGVILLKGCSIVMLTVPTKSLYDILCMEVWSV